MTERAKASILLIDDDPAVLGMTKRVLSCAGFLVDSTTDPRRALEMFSAQPYKLLITDVSMPELTGPELVRQAFRIKPEVKVLFISGGFEEGVRFRWSDPQLPKPFTPDQLLDEIRNIMEGRLATAEAPEQTAAAWDGPERRTLTRS